MKLPILLTLCLLAGGVNPARPQARRTRTQTEQTRSADRERAKRAEADARNILGDGANHSAEELAMAEAKLRRALIRQGVAGR